MEAKDDSIKPKQMIKMTILIEIVAMLVTSIAHLAVCLSGRGFNLLYYPIMIVAVATTSLFVIYILIPVVSYILNKFL